MRFKKIIQAKYEIIALKNLYHGTSSEFDTLKPNDYGIIWLTDDPEAAKRYAKKSYRTKAYNLLTVKLSPTKTLDLRDPKDPLVSEYKRSLELDMGRGTDYHIPDNEWSQHAGYFLLEKYGIDSLTEKHVDTVIVLDASGAYHHLSYAVLNPNIIKIIKSEKF